MTARSSGSHPEHAGDLAKRPQVMDSGRGVIGRERVSRAL